MTQTELFKERRTYLVDHSPVSKIYKQYDYSDMSEFVCDCYGDSTTYRVYGRNKEDFEIYER